MHRLHLLVTILAFLVVLRAQTDEPTPIPTTEAPTEAPTTDPPTTEAPSTEPPTAEPPTEAPEAPITEPPITEAPVTEPPITEAPITEAPITEAPITETPTTEAPTTKAPATEVPSTTPMTDGPSVETPAPVVPTPDLLESLEETITGSPHKSGLDSSQIAGICMGLIFGVAIIVLSILFAVRVRRARQADLNGMFGLNDSPYSDESPLPPGKFEAHFIATNPPTIERDSSIPVLSRSQRQSSVPSRTLSVHDEIPMAYGRLSSPGSQTASPSQWPSQESYVEAGSTNVTVSKSPGSLRRRSLAQSYATDYDYQMTDTSSFISVGETSPNGAANWIAAMDTSDEVEEIGSRNSYEV